MRKTFVEEITKHVRINKNIIVVVGDLGYNVWDDFRK